MQNSSSAIHLVPVLTSVQPDRKKHQPDRQASTAASSQHMCNRTPVLHLTHHARSTLSSTGRLHMGQPLLTSYAAKHTPHMHRCTSSPCSSPTVQGRSQHTTHSDSSPSRSNASQASAALEAAADTPPVVGAASALMWLVDCRCCCWWWLFCQSRHEIHHLSILDLLLLLLSWRAASFERRGCYRCCRGVPICQLQRHVRRSHRRCSWQLLRVAAAVIAAVGGAV
jgi:hypothetical protein